jgi:hypothetical protein
MLAVISDLHLTDGTTGETIREGAFRIFRDRLRELVYAASWRTDQRYRPIQRLDLLLLGDILDVVRSAQWLTGDTRPWMDSQSVAYKQKVASITDAILQKNARCFGFLNELKDPKSFSLPRATDDGQPKPAGNGPDAAGRVPVEARIHYLIGNHDWFFGLAGSEYDNIRKQVVAALGLSNAANRPFPHDVDGSDQTREVCAAHQVYARHGDLFDGFNYEGDRKTSSLGDAVVVELLSRFPVEVARQLGKQLPKECLDGLNEIDNVRPMLAVPAWIDGLLRRTCPDPQQAKGVKEIWDRLADDFLKLQFVRDRDKRYKWDDLVDRLERALKFSKGASLQSLSRLLTRWTEFPTGKEEPFYKNAVGERAFKNRTARYIVYGHTHSHEVVPLDACYTGQGLFNQMYLNAGTWRRVHKLARWNPKEEEFMGYDMMTYLVFFKDDERGGRKFESWSGTLGS